VHGHAQVGAHGRLGVAKALVAQLAVHQISVGLVALKVFFQGGIYTILDLQGLNSCYLG
jgi:hypothetical protein